MKKLSDIFDVQYGHSLELNSLKKTKNGIPFVSRTAQNNGVSAKIQPIVGLAPLPGGTITVALGGSVLETFLQTEPYYTGYHIFSLSPKTELSIQERLFYCACIRANKYRYNYGRQANRTLRDILLPSPSEIPAWVNKAKIPAIPNKNTEVEGVVPSDLKMKNWKYLNTKIVFEEISIANSIDLSKLKPDPYGINYVGRTRENNGVTNKVKLEKYQEKYIISGNCITVAMVGNSTCYAFFQNEDFVASQNILILRSNKLNIYSAIFINLLIYQEKYRFSYGRTLTKTYFENMRLKLPADKNEDIDWKFMEDYIKSLPYSMLLK